MDLIFIKKIKMDPDYSAMLDHFQSDSSWIKSYNQPCFAFPTFKILETSHTKSKTQKNCIDITPPSFYLMF